MNTYVRKILPFASLIIIIVGLSALRPDTFLTADNFINVFSRSSVNGIVAVGMTAIIISGGIDLSVGSILALAGMVGAWTMLTLAGSDPNGTLWAVPSDVPAGPGRLPDPTALAMLAGTLAGIAAGTICGLANGALISKLRLPPFIVTLGTMSALRGIAYVMNDGQPYNVATYKYLGEGAVLDMRVCVLIFAAVALLAALALRYTRLGRYTYAIGSNREAAYHAGINVDRSLIWIYTLTGLAIGIAAMIQTSRTVSAQPTAGIALELDVIAAVVIGGASLSGGRGTIIGTIIGTLLIAFLRNGCTLLGISTNVQLIVIGAIIVAAVTVDQLARSKAE
jgi:ribose/xylose/arabinose/galactoside ABC-type transport system permease subunit